MTPLNSHVLLAFGARRHALAYAHKLMRLLNSRLVLALGADSLSLSLSLQVDVIEKKQQQQQEATACQRKVGLGKTLHLDKGSFC